MSWSWRRSSNSVKCGIVSSYQPTIASRWNWKTTRYTLVKKQKHDQDQCGLSWKMLSHPKNNIHYKPFRSFLQRGLLMALKYKMPRVGMFTRVHLLCSSADPKSCVLQRALKRHQRCSSLAWRSRRPQRLDSGRRSS